MEQLVARQSHKLEVGGSNHPLATKGGEMTEDMFAFTKKEIEAIGYRRYFRKNNRAMKMLIPFFVAFGGAMVVGFIFNERISDVLLAIEMGALMLVGCIPLWVVMNRCEKKGKQYREAYEKRYGKLLP